MTITARTREIISQTDDAIVQTVRILVDGAPKKDIPVRYAPGPDIATAQANCTAAVLNILARNASDASSVAVPALTLLDLTPPTPPAPTPAQLDRAAWFAKFAVLRHRQTIQAAGLPLTTQHQDALDSGIATLKTQLAATFVDAYGDPG